MPQSQPPSLRKRFQSTPSVGRATPSALTTGAASEEISIHALRGEGDADRRAVRGDTMTFQSTPSVGRATRSSGKLSLSIRFQSTPSVGRATIVPAVTGAAAPLFQSTPSVGRATECSPPCRGTNAISIHALRGEGDDRPRGEKAAL